MSAWGVATVCGNSARPEFASQCMRETAKKLVPDRRAKQGAKFWMLPDLCVNGPSNASEDTASTAARLACVRPSAATESCPGDSNPKSGTAAINAAPNTLPVHSRIHVCAAGKGSDGLCCARRLLEKGKCGAGETESANAAGLACQGVSTTYPWGKVLQCLDDPNKKPADSRSVCPPKENHIASATICASDWGLADYTRGAAASP